jgi:hypothetical protein
VDTFIYSSPQEKGRATGYAQKEKTMSNTEKIPTTTTPPIPEIVGIDTSLTGIESAKNRLQSAIIAAVGNEKELEEFRKYVVAMPEKTAPEKLQKAFTVLHQAELEAQIADNSKKAVSDALSEVLMHIDTVKNLADQIQAKHGKPVPTVKESDKKPRDFGNITSSNMDNIRNILTDRGYSNVQFLLLEDSKHYEVTADKAGQHRHNRYTSNVTREWL